MLAEGLSDTFKGGLFAGAGGIAIYAGLKIGGKPGIFLMLSGAALTVYGGYKLSEGLKDTSDSLSAPDVGTVKTESVGSINDLAQGQIVVQKQGSLSAMFLKPLNGVTLEDESLLGVSLTAVVRYFNDTQSPQTVTSSLYVAEYGWMGSKAYKQILGDSFILQGGQYRDVSFNFSPPGANISFGSPKINLRAMNGENLLAEVSAEYDA